MSTIVGLLNFEFLYGVFSENAANFSAVMVSHTSLVNHNLIPTDPKNNNNSNNSALFRMRG